MMVPLLACGMAAGRGFLIMANERFINARNRRRGFTTVLNQMLDDPMISLEAKGLLTILLSNKDDWKINMKEIINRSKNGRDAHYRVINELINSGYFFRIQIKEKGKFKDPDASKRTTDPYLDLFGRICCILPSAKDMEAPRSGVKRLTRTCVSGAV